MIPRDYQRAAVDAARDQTAAHGNTMLVLPTGAGKTAIAGFYIGEEVEDTARRPRPGAAAHRRADRAEPRRHRQGDRPATSVVKAEQDDWDGRVVFGSVQTLARANRRARMAARLAPRDRRMPPRRGRELPVDHRAGPRRSIRQVKLLGLSATPGPRRRPQPAEDLHQRRLPAEDRHADRARPAGAAAHLHHRPRRRGRAGRAAQPPRATSTCARPTRC